ncbi:restriction endonuclease subunit S [Natronohydrobacter thiooxidans]|uniref:restriction endonuclease subunit S n=1 Tax=Natronohydrobacter thiooxidans TaxID=87172 RepID=UPI0008FF6542|nr:restriction endonuclease subunit S [Natronohydrobacter thiooxidans]
MNTAAYPKYDSYKDSGVEWIGEVPAGWHVEPGRQCLYENKDKNTGMKESTVLSLSYGRVIVKDEDKLTGLVPESFETYQIVQPGDIIIRGTDLQNDMTSLRTGLARDTGIITSAYINLRPKAEIDPVFLHYLLHSYDVKKVFYALGSGLRQNLSYDDFKYLRLPIPSPEEQRAIAAFLDEKCAKVDEAVRIKEEQIALLRERRQILIQQAVTRGLNPAAPMKDSGIDWIGQIPAHWVVVPIMAVGDVIDPNPSHRNPEYVEDGFPFISTQEFRPDGTIEIDTPRRVSTKTVEEQEARCHFSQGSLVFSRKGTIGAVRILPSGVRLGILDSLCVINPKKRVDPEFLYWSLSSDYLAAQYGPTLRGAALPQLSVGRVRSLKIILPPKSEQPSLVEHIAREAGKVDSAIRLKEEQIAALKEYKTSLINAAVTGKIKVS